MVEVTSRLISAMFYFGLLPESGDEWMVEVRKARKHNKSRRAVKIAEPSCNVDELIEALETTVESDKPQLEFQQKKHAKRVIAKLKELCRGVG